MACMALPREIICIHSRNQANSNGIRMNNCCAWGIFLLQCASNIAGLNNGMRNCSLGLRYSLHSGMRSDFCRNFRKGRTICKFPAASSNGLNIRYTRSRIRCSRNIRTRKCFGNSKDYLRFDSCKGSDNRTPHIPHNLRSSGNLIRNNHTGRWRFGLLLPIR